MAYLWGALILLVFEMMYLGTMGILWLWKIRRASEKVGKPNAILVLAYWPGPEFDSRLQRAAWLHKQTGLPILLFGGRMKGTSGMSLVEIGRSALLQAGVLRKCIYPRDNPLRLAYDTSDEILLAVECMERWDYESLYVVSSPFQLFRAWLMFAWKGYFVHLIPSETKQPAPRFQIEELISWLWTLFIDPLWRTPLPAFVRWRRRA